MAKRSGLASSLYIAGYSLGNDIGAVDEIGGGPEPIDVTGLDKSAHERIGGIRDGRMSFTAFFNPSTDKAHDRLSDLPTADVIMTLALTPGVGSIGAPSCSLVAKQLNYDGARGDDGSFTFKVDAVANGYGIGWGETLTPGISFLSGAASTTSLDYGAAVGTTNFGLQAWLHCFTFTGTSATVAIQGSSDNGAGDAWADITGAVFTTVTGITSERIQTSRTQAVERYLRVNVTGTFSTCWLAIQVAKNTVQTLF
jgi:hypothetical protein